MRKLIYKLFFAIGAFLSLIYLGGTEKLELDLSSSNPYVTKSSDKIYFTDIISQFDSSELTAGHYSHSSHRSHYSHSSHSSHRSHYSGY